jgi:hypothetical protein
MAISFRCSVLGGEPLRCGALVRIALERSDTAICRPGTLRIRRTIWRATASCILAVGADVVIPARVVVGCPDTSRQIAGLEIRSPVRHLNDLSILHRPSFLVSLWQHVLLCRSRRSRPLAEEGDHLEESLALSVARRNDSGCPDRCCRCLIVCGGARSLRPQRAGKDFPAHIGPAGRNVVDDVWAHLRTWRLERPACRDQVICFPF